MKEQIKTHTLRIRKTLVYLVVITMALAAIPLSGSAADSYKNTTAVTAITNGATNVGTTAEFVKAAADSRVTRINLSNNLVFAEFQQFTRNAESDLVVDGGGKYSLRVSKSDWWQIPWDPTNHVSMEFKDGFRKVTFQNISLSGETFNAFAYGKGGMTIVFDKVNFDGPALVAMKNGSKSSVTIKDSTLNLRKRVPDSKDSAKTWYLYPSEAAEIYDGDVILSGNVTITKIDPLNTSEDHDEVFNFKGKESNLIVDAGANVNINNYSRASGSLYWAGLLWIDLGSAKVNFTIGENAKFNFYAAGGHIIENYGLNNFIVKENAQVVMKAAVPVSPKIKSVTLNEDNGSYFKSKNIDIRPNARVDIIGLTNLLYAREAVAGVENLRVNENATFRVLAPANTVSEVLLKMHGAAPSIYIDNPKEVLFYNGNKVGGKAAAVSAALVGDSYNDPAKADTTFTFIGSGISTWNTSSNVISMAKDTWVVNDPAKARTWGTGSTLFKFTLTGKISKQNGTFNSPVLSDPKDGLGVKNFPSNNPADSTNGIKSFADKSVIQFNGSAIGPDRPYIAYKPNGGSGQSTDDYDTSGGKFTIKDLGFRKGDADFVDWNTKPDGSGTPYSVGSKVSLTAPLTLYAQYNKILYIKYMPNGGSGQATEDYANNAGTFTVNDQGFRKNDYDFIGWNTNADGSGVSYTVGDQPNLTAPLTLYAQYDESLYIRYDANGGVGGVVKDYNNENGTFTVKFVGFWQRDCEFSSWNTKPDGSGYSYPLSKKLKITAPLTLYAQYRIIWSQ